MKLVRPVFCGVFLFLHFLGQGQVYSNKGRDFWITYPAHIDGLASKMGIYITSDVAATGTIQVGSQSIPFTVAPNSAERKFITNIAGADAANSQVYLTQDDAITSNAGIHVVSDNPVAVYAHIINTSRSGATLVLPSNVWGKQYIVPSYRNLGNQTGQQFGYGTITVVAAEANTTIQINSPVTTRTGRPAGVPFQVTLPNPGDVYQVQFQQSADISGTIVQSVVAGNSTACKKIAVFSSTTWSSFGCTGATSGDNLYQQLFPTAAWGKNFATVPAKTRIADIYRVFVIDPTTVVTKIENGISSTLTGLVNNSYYEFTTGSPTFIQSDKPASVIQYFTTMSCQAGATIGDPEMVVINPVEQTVNNITVFSAHRNYVPSQQSGITNCYLNIVIKSNSVSSFKINGNAPTALFIPITGTAYSYLQEDVTTITLTNPVQTLTADSSFIAIAYGFGNVESYGYNAGTNVKDFSQVAVFQNAYKRIDSAVTCVNSPFQMTIPFNFEPTSMRWDFSAAPGILPPATIANTPPVYDSISKGLYYYSPRTTFTFSKANTIALRDTIKLYTTSATPDGCGSTDQLFTIPVKVNEIPVANFTITHTGCVNDSVQLSDKSIYTGGLLSQWLWDFGDGSTVLRDSAVTFNKKYNSSGNYLIKLKAISDVGCGSVDAVKTVTITDKPIARFNLPNLLCSNADITYTDASTTSSGTLVKWTWNLDDGNATIINTTNASVTTKYSSTGTRNVSLQVENNTGCKSDSYTQVVKINALPAVGFIIPEICLNDANAQFTDTSTIAEGSNVSYAWLFNVGTPVVSPGPTVSSSSAKNPQVHYNDKGYYKVSLTVTSDKGCASTLIQDFTVNGATPKAAFDMVNAGPYCGTKVVQLKNNSTVDFGNVTRLEIFWDNTGAPTVKQTDESPAPGKLYGHSYPDPSSPKQYTVRMVAYSGGGSCVSEVSKTITVYPQPKAAFAMSASQACSGAIVDFTDNSNPGSSSATSWVWELGNGNTSTRQNPSRQYNDSGLMAVSLHFTNVDGCISDTASKTLTVYPNPQVTLVHKQVVLEGGILTIKPVWVYGNSLQYLWTPATSLSSDTAREPKATPANDITYKLIVTAEGGCTATDTTFIRVLKGPEVPNIFSPNGDGINDTWYINYLDGYPGATVDVYNRSGQVVYRSVGYDKPWDGTYQGKPLSVGTYYYIINPRNGKQVITGSVTIIK